MTGIKIHARFSTRNRLRRDSRADDRCGVAGTARAGAETCSTVNGCCPRAARRYLDTPRRLAVLAPGIPAAQPDVDEQVTGPAVECRIQRRCSPHRPRMRLQRRLAWMFPSWKAALLRRANTWPRKSPGSGRTAAEILAEALPKEIASIYWPKNMYWRKPTERFVRPVRWLVAMLDGRSFRWSSTESAREPVARTPNSGRWFSRDPAGRDGLCRSVGEGQGPRSRASEQQIRKALDAATRTIPGARWREDKSLLDAVVNLTEWPSVILGASIRNFWNCRKKSWSRSCVIIRNILRLRMPDGRLCRIFWRC